VLSGTFNITTQSQGKEVHLDTVGAGDCLGEVAIFNPDKASATVTGVGAGRLWAIESESLRNFDRLAEPGLRSAAGYQRHFEPTAQARQCGDPVPFDRAGFSERPSAKADDDWQAQVESDLSDSL